MTLKEIFDYKLTKLIGATKFATVEDVDKDFVLAQAQNKIQIYCHRRDIPKGAYYVWADMAIAILKEIDSSLFEDATIDDIEDKITSIKVGDTTLNISDTNKAGDATQDNDTILNEFSSQLKAFRKFASGQGDGLRGC